MKRIINIMAMRTALTLLTLLTALRDSLVPRPFAKIGYEAKLCSYRDRCTDWNGVAIWSRIIVSKRKFFFKVCFGLFFFWTALTEFGLFCFGLF